MEKHQFTAPSAVCHFQRADKSLHFWPVDFLLHINRCTAMGKMCVDKVCGHIGTVLVYAYMHIYDEFLQCKSLNNCEVLSFFQNVQVECSYKCAAGRISTSQRGICVLLSPTTLCKIHARTLSLCRFVHHIYLVDFFFLFINTNITRALLMTIYKFTHSIRAIFTCFLYICIQIYV